MRRGGCCTLLRIFQRSGPADRANENHQLPRRRIVLFAVRISKRWHSRQPHAILNNVVNFAIAEILSFWPPQIRGLGIKIRTDAGSTVAILAVASRTAVRELVTRFLEERSRLGSTKWGRRVREWARQQR
jgi:hypothetical protein